MKARLRLVLLVGLMAGIAGYAIAHRFLCQPPPSAIDRLRDVSHLARALDLRPEQVETMMSLQSRLCAQLAICCARHCVCRKELAVALIAEPFDAVRAQELRESLCRCYADSERLALEHIRNLRGILDAPQRARFDRMILETMAGPCGLCMNCGDGCDKPQGAK